MGKMETRNCHRCKESLPLTAEFFLRDKSRIAGLAYECRQCHRKRKLGRDNRPDRYALMTPVQRLKNRARQLKYSRTDKGRAIFLRSAYKKIDACDLTSAEVLELIKKPCVYCGTTEYPRGLDRIDNDLPHIRTNVLPACAYCNFARGDRFTAAEMDRIGAVIRQVLSDRKPTATGNEARP